MKAICQDLRDECTALAGLLGQLDAAAWQRPTAFYGWTPYDEIAHLAFFDELATRALSDRARFQDERTAIEAQLAQGIEISAMARKHFATLAGAALLACWRRRYTQLIAMLELLEPKERLPWFGPEMSARSFATARLMETWAHGQDVYDLLDVSRTGTPRLRHVAHLGVVTFQWTFANRGLPVPGSPPYVQLGGPQGEVWSWGEPSPDSFVRGAAMDFCLVVTQRRHYRDTLLEIGGEVAHQWLSIAQCFAGPPADGPAPGVRRRS